MIKLLILLAALAAILAVIVFRVQYIEPRDARADYLWEKENFPILDRLYQEKDLEALMDFYEQAVEEIRTIDRWEHSGIFRWLMSCRDAREYLALEQSGETLNEYQQALLLDDYWMMRGLYDSEVILTEKDREYIRPYVEATLNSLADRYTFTAEEEKKFEDSLRNNYGYPRYRDVLSSISSSSVVRVKKRTISRIVSNERRKSNNSCSSRYIPSIRIRFRDGRTSKKYWSGNSFSS